MSFERSQLAHLTRTANSFCGFFVPYWFLVVLVVPAFFDGTFDGML
jgi:hypothetical protein